MAEVPAGLRSRRDIAFALTFAGGAVLIVGAIGTAIGLFAFNAALAPYLANDFIEGLSPSSIISGIAVWTLLVGVTTGILALVAAGRLRHDADQGRREGARLALIAGGISLLAPAIGAIGAILTVVGAILAFGTLPGSHFARRA